MTQTTRKFLFLFFVAAFFIITPLVILYAKGYQLSLDGRPLVKTGMLILDSEPAGAKIYLDGRPQKAFSSRLLPFGEELVTPAKLKGILPSEHLVRFELDGYWPWEKRLVVRGGESTYAEDVILFKRSLPELVATSSAAKMLPSPTGERMLLGDDRRLLVASFADSAAPLALAASGTPSAWSSDGRRFLAGRAIYQADTGDQLIDLEKLLGQNLSNVKWSDSSADTLYYQLGGQLYRFNLAGRTSESLLPSATPTAWPKGDLIDYLVKDSGLYLAYYQPGRVELTLYSLGERKISRTVAIAASRQAVFAYPNKASINLLDRSSRTLYLFDFGGFNPLLDTLSEIDGGRWIDNTRLLGWNESEIFTYNASIKQKTIISRLSEPVRQAAWHPSNNYIIYATDRRLVSLELDDRDRRHTIDLLETEQLAAFEIAPKAEELHFVGRYQGRSGLFRLKL